ncbi:hypothetical protein BDN70DRAFT_401033 [Pholiota conissans]|uniref:Exocyst complex component SEC5 n=1 Tax=Pholiota conissans TaxID=109636 RepID=A0A9P5Z7T1_9AGAR|nr:hypothetical protein BDN70DRAFT_401033 [Pholiota conissans]
MFRLNNKTDEATLLKAYRIRTLKPKKWEDVDHELEGTIAGSLTGANIGESDPLGLGVVRIRMDLDMEARANISIASKTFDPAAYLSTVHPNATYHDLAKGIAHLQNAIDARSGALRTLVEDSFDRFVAVKSTTHGLYEDMKIGILAPESDFGTKLLREHLKNGVRKGNQVFLPVLESASKAEKLGTTLRIFERSKFFFNLPSFIMESIATGRYELALRDYKKGKYILDHRPSQLLPIGSNKEGTAPASAHQQQMRILNRVWGNVEKAMAELKKVLISQLQDMTKSSEEHEKVLETLLEIQPNDDTIWAYFDSHHVHIMDMMTDSYRAGVKLIDYALRNSLPTSQDSWALDALLIRELQFGILQLEAKKEDIVIAMSSADSTWHAIHDLVKAISESVSSSLPAFWKISKDFIDEKTMKKPSASGVRRSSSQCRTMALDIVKLYISLISQLFVLSDMVVMASSEKNGTNNNLPPRIPTNSHSLSTAYHLQKISAEVQECVGDIIALGISSEVRSGLKCLMDSLKWRFADILGRAWVRDAELFYNLEFWIAHRDATSSSTRYLSQFESFQKHIMTSAYKLIIVSGDSFAAAKSSGRKRGVPQILSNKIIKTFFDAIHAFLEGLILLASEDSPIVKKPELVEGKGSMEMSLHELVDLKDANNRLLVVLSNLVRISQIDLPSMITQLESLLGSTFVDEKNELNDIIDELDETLFERYTKPRAQLFKICLKSAVSKAQIDWYTVPIPLSIRPYAFELLNYLVEVHAHICAVAPALLGKALTLLTEALVDEVSRVFRQVPRFGLGGFLTKALGIYTKETQAGKALDHLLTKQIGQLCDPLTRNPEFQTALNGTQKILAQARKATEVQFMCFAARVADTEGSSLAKRRTRMRQTLRQTIASPVDLDSERLT